MKVNQVNIWTVDGDIQSERIISEQHSFTDWRDYDNFARDLFAYKECC